MSQTTSIKAECECGHRWELQKPPDEMADGPRCSECGAIGKEITVHRGGGHEERDGEIESSSLVASVERQARREDLLDRVASDIERVENAAPVGKQAPDDLQATHRRLTMVEEELTEQESVPESELNEIETFVQELEDSLEEIPELDRISDLETQIESLEDEKSKLETEIEAKQRKFNRLDAEFQKLWNLWKQTESNAKIYRRGLQDGFEFARENPNAQAREMIGAIEWPFPVLY